MTGHDTAMIDSTGRIWTALEDVKDPEIPTVSIVEMGMIEAVLVEGARASVTMIPTFSGCPALHEIRESIGEALRAAGFEAEVFVSKKPWSTDRLAESAREKMRAIGLAPPASHGGNVEWEWYSAVPCPFCGSTDTDMENAFGPTLCRSIFYCRSCEQPFEKFKPL